MRPSIFCEWLLYSTRLKGVYVLIFLHVNIFTLFLSPWPIFAKNYVESTSSLTTHTAHDLTFFRVILIWVLLGLSSIDLSQFITRDSIQSCKYQNAFSLMKVFYILSYQRAWFLETLHSPELLLLVVNKLNKIGLF